MDDPDAHPLQYRPSRKHRLPPLYFFADRGETGGKDAKYNEAPTAKYIRTMFNFNKVSPAKGKGKGKATRTRTRSPTTIVRPPPIQHLTFVKPSKPQNFVETEPTLNEQNPVHTISGTTLLAPLRNLVPHLRPPRTGLIPLLLGVLVRGNRLRARADPSEWPQTPRCRAPFAADREASQGRHLEARGPRVRRADRAWRRVRAHRELVPCYESCGVTRGVCVFPSDGLRGIRGR